MFDSRNTWNLIHVARSNLGDAKHNWTTTFMFDSRNTWNVIYIARSNIMRRKAQWNCDIHAW